MVLQPLEVMEVLDNQKLQKLIEKTAYPQLSAWVILPQMLNGGTGRSSVVAQHDQSLG